MQIDKFFIRKNARAIVYVKKKQYFCSRFEKKNQMKKLIFSLAAITLMTTACTQQQTTGIHLENLDTTAVAQNDFYQFACGGWMQNNPLTAEYSRFGSFDKLGLQNLEQVNGLIQEIAVKVKGARDGAHRRGALLCKARRSGDPGVSPLPVGS